MAIYFKIYKRLYTFDLDVECSMGNELLAIEGASGAGKTTILNCLAGITTPDAGTITVGPRTLFQKGDIPEREDSRPVPKAHINIPAEKRNIGYLFQSYALFPHMTVWDNVLYGLKNQKKYRKRQTRRELLEYAHYTMDILGITHLADKSANAISGGEKQRAALARAMVTKPSFLLLDEPFSALDEATKDQIYDEFSLFKKTLRIPTILITHNHKETELFADKTIFLHQGKIEKKEKSNERSSC